MNDPLTTLVSLGQLGALLEIARRIGSLRSDHDNLRKLYQRLRTRVQDLEEGA